MFVVAVVGHAVPVEYVRDCSLYGAGVHYMPGTDVCVHEGTGDARQQTEAGTWRSVLPYPDGKWAATPQLECGFGWSLGCVANSRIVNMPAASAVNATAAYPSIDSWFLNSEQTIVSGPYTYGSKLVVTTDFETPSQVALTYFDVGTELNKPTAGRLAVSVCVEQGLSR